VRVADATPGLVAVTLSLAPALEERVIDWLLARGDVATFTSVVVHAYGGDSRGLSVAEQVSGRQRRVELTVELPAGAVDRWLEDVATAFVGTDLRYRVTPILLSGQGPAGAQVVADG
jgi:hypothetical protein